MLLPHELGVIAAGAAHVLAERLEGYDALLLGPGLGRERATMAFVEALLVGGGARRRIGFAGAGESQAPSPALPSLIVDADGLNILAGMEGWPKRLPPESILTPHPGEMSRLMECTVGDVQADRVTVAQSQAAAWGQVIVLKGAHTVVAAADGRAAVSPFANPALATAGTGDVLAGVIAGLLAQGLDRLDAAACGVHLHGAAGERVRESIGDAGAVAGDLLPELPAVIRDLK